MTLTKKQGEIGHLNYPIPVLPYKFLLRVRAGDHTRVLNAVMGSPTPPAFPVKASSPQKCTRKPNSTAEVGGVTKVVE